MSGFLSDMATRSRERADALLRSRPLASLRAAALASALPVPLRRVDGGFIVIAEVKRASPSAGVIAREIDGDASAFVAAQAQTYAQHGASCVSVLTEPSAFEGDLAHAASAARAIRPHGVPVMRKDFLVDPAQVYEARAAGCSGVLLIVRMLSDEDLSVMLRAVDECALFVLLEAFDAADLARARSTLAGADCTRRVLVGLNTRDLATLAVNPASLSISDDQFPPGFPRIAESGMLTPDDVRTAAELGYQGVLVGTALMRTADPGTLLESMVRAGRDDHRAITHAPLENARTRVKVCGLTTLDHAQSVARAGSDAIGCVMVESPRRVTPAFAAQIASTLPPFVQPVLVFRDEALDATALGLHDELSRFMLQRNASAAIREQQGSLDQRTIPVLRLGTPSLHAELEACATRFHTLLIEGPRSGVGETVDWHAVAPIARTHRIILAGGLTPENVGEAIRIVRPYAVDVSSGVESSPGVKDPIKIAAFLAAVHAADAAAAQSRVESAESPGGKT